MIADCGATALEQKASGCRLNGLEIENRKSQIENAKAGRTSGDARHSKKLRDPVHKDIYLSEAELRVLDTPEMQRLRGIRQLGAAFYVYPGAHHTRFEHCLGTFWMARRIIRSIEAFTGHGFGDVEKQAVLLAALAHDVTHVPFGHTFEDERKLLDRHDVSAGRFARFLEEGALGKLLDASEAGRLARDILRPDHPLPPALRCLREIVSGTVCADLLDYLGRDNYYCGLSQNFDERVFQYFAVRDGELMLNLQHHGLLRRDALSEITNLLRIRYVLSERVYYHHAKIACGVMISQAVERAMAHGLAEGDLCELTDDALLYRLEHDYGADPYVGELARAFRERRLYKRCYMLSRSVGEEKVQDLVRAYHFNQEGARNAAEECIARALGAEPHEVAIYCAPQEMGLKEADVRVILAGGKTPRLSELNSAEIQVMKDQHRALWGFYIFVSRRLAERLERAGDACREVIGLPNELPREARGHSL